MAFSALAGLLACAPVIPTSNPTQSPHTRPVELAQTPATRQLANMPRSARTEEMRVYYRRLQNDLLTQGLLRQDGGGPDTPFNDRQLTENFIRIALFDEYDTTGAILRAQETASELRRWDQPIRMSIEFGNSVPPAQRAADTSFIAAYIARLSRITGLSMALTNGPSNFQVLVLGEDDRAGFEPRLRQIAPDLKAAPLRAFRELPRDNLCLVLANFNDTKTATYSNTVAVIRAEHPDLLRQGCFHEEIAQGLGLANDSPAARPSIFNDDEEFGLLTAHDEMLLRILYDPRLRPGMTAPVAAPIVRKIAIELTSVGPL